MILRTIFFFSVILLFCFSCAKQSSPTGGPKDTIPPILIRSFPTNKEINFKSKKIDLVFSEMVIVNNPKEQIIITPSVGKDYKITAKKKTITLEFENDFADSTTYTINFREAIQDITEKNPLRNLQLAFSTGNYIDSMSISGKVFNILNDKETKNATVSLYQNADTFNIFKHKPSYITKTTDNGFFRIENIKSGKYFIYAFEDKNKNLVVDSKSESYGFKTNAQDIKVNLTKVFIPIQRLDARPLKLTSARPYDNYFNIKASKNLISYSLTSDSVKFISCFGADQSNIKVFNTFSSKDSIAANFIGYDSIGNSIDTTLFIKFSYRKVEPTKFTFKIDESIVQANKGLLQIKMSFNKPILSVNFDSIFYKIDSAKTINFVKEDLKWDNFHNNLIIDKSIDKKYFIKETQSKTLQPNKSKQKSIIKNQLIIGNGAFISVDNDSIKSAMEKTKIFREEDTGIMIVSIATKENFILELLDNNYKTLVSTRNKSTVRIENLPPTSYILKLIIDTNNNGKWDAGNYLNCIEPEPIIIYRNEKGVQLIPLKANWELGPLLIKY